MTPERWQQIRDVLEQALELAPEHRSAFLNRACSSDPSLRQEVDTLLASSDRVRSGFLESPPDPATLTSGTKLGEYEVKSQLGAGGMGEVYRARDARLGRDVAIKVLPATLSADPERLRRFEQEARAAAALNHPNILAVFQMGTFEGAPYLVSELLEGETLREQLQRGQLVVRKAIDYGVQIARGLAAAHEKGIVHRDLKPENLFVTKDGRVKILDFGLAKLTQPQPDSDHIPATMSAETEPGAVMGTVGYMSPEQVRGQNADHRTDIFSFGAILYETLTGKRAFQKPTAADTQSAILNEDPALISQATTNIPPALQRVVHRCLEKKPEQRFQSAPDLAFALDALSESGASADWAVAGRVGSIAARSRKLIVPAAVAVFALSAVGYFYFHRAAKLTEKDTIVLGDFSNNTGDAVFDDTLKTALSVSLSQSPFLNVLSESKVATTLKLMTRSPETKLTPDVARELCQREGSKAYVAGSIASLGSQYVLGLKVVNCQSGDVLAQEQATASTKEKVLDTLGATASKLRAELGESLVNLQKFDVPLPEATTSSLEALHAYTLGLRLFDDKGPAAALPYHLRAIELDPNFAMGYWAAGTDYFVLLEQGRASEDFTKAFQLREHTSDREKLAISATYYVNVTGELEKAAQTYQEWIASYPREYIAHTYLGFLYADQGQYEKSVEAYREAIRLLPDNVRAYGFISAYLLSLQRFDEASQIIREAQARKLDDYGLHADLYGLGFLRANSFTMAEEQQWFAGRPEESFGYSLASDTEAFSGHLVKARELTERSVESAIRSDSRETGAIWLENSAIRDAAFGNLTDARKAAAGGLKLAPASQGVASEAALAFAMAGDAARAESLAQDLNRHYPLDTQMQSLWLPATQAQLALNRKDSSDALRNLEVAFPIELGNTPFELYVSCLYPTYIRGEAYLAAGQGNAAAAQFQKILDHSGMVWNCWTGALARLGVARANALQAKTSLGADAGAARVRALGAYKDFLALWKDADPDIPIYKAAKAEYAKLQ
jgi:eukaryotic-like serine/threonine-protein kinase